MCDSSNSMVASIAGENFKKFFLCFSHGEEKFLIVFSPCDLVVVVVVHLMSTLSPLQVEEIF